MRKPGVIFLLILLAFTACEPNETIINVNSVALSHSEATLAIDETLQLVASITPEEAANKNIAWSVSDGDVASVTQTGLVTAKSEGQCIVSVVTEDGGFEANCMVTVTGRSIPVSGVELDITEDTLDIECQLQLTATISPDDATNKNLSWSSSNTEVATVSGSGLVSAVGGGSTQIIVTTEDGGFTANCEISVNGKGSITSIMDKGFLKTSGYNSGVDLAIDGDGTPYLALNAYEATLVSDTKAKTEVWKYSGSASWSQFGADVAVTDDEAYAPGITIDRTGKVYVSHLYYDDVTDVKYGSNVVASSNGGAWTYLGLGAGSLIKNGSNALNGGTELAMKQDGTLLIATMDYGAGYVHYFDGTNWQSYNSYKTNNSSSFWGGGIELKCFGNVPYVSIRTGSGDGKTGVLYGNESNGVSGEWEWLNASYASFASYSCGFQDTKVNEASLALSSEGDIYTAFKAYDGSDWRAFVRKSAHNGTSWETIGSQIGDNDNQVEVVVSNDRVYLLVAKYDDGIEIYRLNQCGIWVHEGTTSKPDTYYNIDAIAGKNGEIYIGYECMDNNRGKVGVYQYTPYFEE